jgi:MurNAc alpha-1-phosphate uridylyltransferase
MNTINQAFILAAGRGRRMLPLTNTIPKPLAKIKGVAIIDHIIKKVSALPAINKVVINSYYLANILESHLYSLNNPKIIISHEEEKLETGGGLINALRFFDQDKPILIINGDLFWIDKNNSLLNKVIENFDENKMDILLALKPKNQFFGYDGNGDFNFNKTTGEITKTNKKSHSHTYIGIQIIHPKILKNKLIDKIFSLNCFFKIAQGKSQENEIILQKIIGIEAQEKIFHIGTVKSLNQINQTLANDT